MYYLDMLAKRFCDECLTMRPVAHAHFIDDVCGQTFGQCARGSCTHRGSQPKSREGRAKDLRKLFVELTRQYVLVPPTEGGRDFIFGTLSFGCTFCGKAEKDPAHQYNPALSSTHMYRSPGRQNARKKLETFLNDIVPPIFNTDFVHHAEEFGHETGRIHMHLIIGYRGTVDTRVLRSMSAVWTDNNKNGFGFARLERLLSENGMDYIDKTFGYISKGEVDEMVITPISYVDMRERADGLQLSWQTGFEEQLV